MVYAGGTAAPEDTSGEDAGFGDTDMEPRPDVRVNMLPKCEMYQLCIGEKRGSPL